MTTASTEASLSTASNEVPREHRDAERPGPLSLGTSKSQMHPKTPSRWKTRIKFTPQYPAPCCNFHICSFVMNMSFSPISPLERLPDSPHSKVELERGIRTLYRESRILCHSNCRHSSLPALASLWAIS